MIDVVLKSEQLISPAKQLTDKNQISPGEIKCPSNSRNNKMSETECPVFMAEHVAKIKEAYSNMTVDHFALFDRCAAANTHFDRKNVKRELTKQLPFSASKFSKYAQIGADERLKDPSRRERLPPSYSIIYEVHQLSDEELEALERAGKLTLALRRSDVIKLRKGPTGTQPRTPKLPDDFYAAVKPTRTMTNLELSKLDIDLSKLADQHAVKVIRPPQAAPSGEYDRGVRFMRREAKNFVRDWLQRRKKTVGSNAFSDKPYLRKYAGFSPDDIEIDSDADEDRIRQVFEAIGNEDQFERIRQSAYERFPMDQTHVPHRWQEDVAHKPPTPSAFAAEMEEVKLTMHPASSLTGTRKPVNRFEGFK